ncbi:MAG: NUDIX hydrolase [Kiloniellaceae bacterium]
MDLRAALRQARGMDGDAFSGDVFSGAKIALVCGARLVTYKRDLKPTIPWPGLWDLPGGGREGDESPVECALRETEEEFGLVLAPARIHWRRRYPGVTVPGLSTWFLAAAISEAEVAAIRFGDEGQCWQMMECRAFRTHPQAVGHLQDRLSDYLEAVPGAAG